MTDRATNEAIALGRCCINRDPLSVLEQLHAKVSWAPRLGYVIVLGESQDSYTFKTLTDCIAFNTGGDTLMKKPTLFEKPKSSDQ